ncbi:hypothetical protein CLOM_g17435 [Closterium sp. NIES-68]|nr:hypothetical protein CLOM_g17435 [Closterium sp. NIES-68]
MEQQQHQQQQQQQQQHYKQRSSTDCSERGADAGSSHSYVSSSLPTVPVEASSVGQPTVGAFSVDSHPRHERLARGSIQISPSPVALSPPSHERSAQGSRGGHYEANFPVEIFESTQISPSPVEPSHPRHERSARGARGGCEEITSFEEIFESTSPEEETTRRLLPVCSDDLEIVIDGQDSASELVGSAPAGGSQAGCGVRSSGCFPGTPMAGGRPSASARLTQCFVIDSSAASSSDYRFGSSTSNDSTASTTSSSNSGSSSPGHAGDDVSSGGGNALSPEFADAVVAQSAENAGTRSRARGLAQRIWPGARSSSARGGVRGAPSAEGAEREARGRSRSRTRGPVRRASAGTAHAREEDDAGGKRGRAAQGEVAGSAGTGKAGGKEVTSSGRYPWLYMGLGRRSLLAQRLFIAGMGDTGGARARSSVARARVPLKR